MVIKKQGGKRIPQTELERRFTEDQQELQKKNYCEQKKVDCKKKDCKHKKYKEVTKNYKQTCKHRNTIG